MNNCKLSWALVAALSVALVAFAYNFMTGSVAPSDDGRIAVQLSKDERNALLLEMRHWLQSVQVILTAASEKDFETVASAARSAGMAAEADVPGALLSKIPLEMKTLGFGTRSKFDEIADDAETMKDSQHTINQVSAAMNNCVACHAAYRFVEEGK